jgi:hypothetical protein
MDNIKEDLVDMTSEDVKLIELSQDYVQWWVFV